MIKAGITGGETRRSGELIRLLIFHPDVELIWVHTASPVAANSRLSALHRGLDGDCNMSFSGGTPRLDDIDVLFMCQDAEGVEQFLAANEIPDDLKVINLSDLRPEGFVYGLPELNRKSMVRGATRATVPSAVAVAVATPLLPLAKGLLLRGPVHVTVSRGIIDASLGEPLDGEIVAALRGFQSTFDGDIVIDIENGDWPRGTIVKASVDVESPLGEIVELYNGFFDDHKLTYILNRATEVLDVVNTAKCLISLDIDGSKLIVTAVTDGLLKGAASTAVHCMNLLFGLYERTGLALKTSVV